MAVFQGTRARTITLPGASARRIPRISQAPLRTRAHIGPMGILLAVILTATMLGLVYLTQTLTSIAASAEISATQAKRDAIGMQMGNQRSLILIDSGADKIAARAVDLGLVALDEPKTLRAP